MAKKNVVFVLNEYNGHGGAQRVASILADEFVQDGHSVSVLSINEQKNEFSYFSENIPVHVLHKSYRATRPKELSSNLKNLKFNTIRKELQRRYMLHKKRDEVKAYFDQFGDEEVYVIMIQVYGMQWVQPLLYRPNVKIIGQSHESFNAAKKSHRYKRILKYYRQVSKFLLLTEKDAEKFEDLGFHNTSVVYNPSPFRGKNEPDKLYENKTIVSTGRLVENKGFDVLIEAFSKVADELPGWKVHIYGEGPADKSLQMLISALDMEERIILKGQSENVQEALSNASFFVLPSKDEGLPMSLIEAQSCGLPCISTDCAPGIREILNEYKDSYIVPVGDFPLMARHIKRLAKDYETFETFSNNAYENSERFDKHVIKQEWYKLFEEIGGSQDAE